MAQEKETISRRPSGRPERTPVGLRQRLAVKNKDPNYVYRIVNDVDDRVAIFQEAGYEVVTSGNETIGDSRVSVASQEGSVKSKPVGNGIRGVLMRIRKEYYEEDQLAKQRLISEREAGLRPDKADGQYGEIRREWK